jgi:hypothetical protein
MDQERSIAYVLSNAPKPTNQSITELRYHDRFENILKLAKMNLNGAKWFLYVLKRGHGHVLSVLWLEVTEENVNKVIGGLEFFCGQTI